MGLPRRGGNVFTPEELDTTAQGKRQRHPGKADAVLPPSTPKGLHKMQRLLSNPFVRVSATSARTTGAARRAPDRTTTGGQIGAPPRKEGEVYL